MALLAKYEDRFLMQVLLRKMLEGLLVLSLVLSQRNAIGLKGSFESLEFVSLEMSRCNSLSLILASWRSLVFRLRRNCLPERLIRL